MTYHVPFFIISVTNNKGEHDEKALRFILANFSNAHPVTGRFCGVEEKGVLIFQHPSIGANEEIFIRLLGGSIGQQSVLLVDANRRAALLYCNDGRLEELPGRWQEHKGEPEPGVNYTKTHDGRYWVVGKEAPPVFLTVVRDGGRVS